MYRNVFHTIQSYNPYDLSAVPQKAFEEIGLARYTDGSDSCVKFSVIQDGGFARVYRKNGDEIVHPMQLFVHPHYNSDPNKSYDFDERTNSGYRTAAPSANLNLTEIYNNLMRACNLMAAAADMFFEYDEIVLCDYTVINEAGMNALRAANMLFPLYTSDVNHESGRLKYRIGKPLFPRHNNMKDIQAHVAMLEVLRNYSEESTRDTH